MGLDMYLTGKKFMSKGPIEDGFELKEKGLRLGYWRKHPDLHGFIVSELAQGKDECQDIELSKEEMLLIIEAIQNNNLPKTSGFFFGESSNDEGEKQEAIEIFNKAIAWIEKKEEGVYKSVEYYASW